MLHLDVCFLSVILLFEVDFCSFSFDCSTCCCTESFLFLWAATSIISVGVRIGSAFSSVVDTELKGESAMAESAISSEVVVLYRPFCLPFIL